LRVHDEHHHSDAPQHDRACDYAPRHDDGTLDHCDISVYAQRAARSERIDNTQFE
jgi:hypothetical protein